VGGAGDTPEAAGELGAGGALELHPQESTKRAEERRAEKRSQE
jgi:hypothetical protein